jgi:hypothetical protein
VLGCLSAVLLLYTAYLGQSRSLGIDADGASNVFARFGAPVRTARIGNYEVLVWNHDLLPAITAGFARGCCPPWLAAEHVGG